MNPDLRSAFVADMTTATLTFSREFDAPRALVWRAWTEAQLLDRWFAPEPLTATTKSMDFRDGGHWHFAMIMPDGTEHWSRFDYVSIRPGEGFEALDGFSDAAGGINPDLPRSTWVAEFEDHGPRCVVRSVTRYASAADLQIVIDMGMEAGVRSTWERLDALLPSLA